MTTTDEVLEDLEISPQDPNCERLGCEGKTAWTPVLMLYNEDGSKAASIGMQLGLCGPHANLIGVSDILTDEAWEFICKSFDERGIPRPYRSMTKIAVYRV